MEKLFFYDLETTGVNEPQPYDGRFFTALRKGGVSRVRRAFEGSQFCFIKF